MTPRHLYVLYDARAITEGTDDASVLCSWGGDEHQDEEEIIKDCRGMIKDYGGSGLLCSYDKTGEEDGKTTCGNEAIVATFVGGKMTRS